MAFTFTDVSYSDPRNDYVRVRLEFMLWDDDVWLPRVPESPRSCGCGAVGTGERTWDPRSPGLSPGSS